MCYPSCFKYPVTKWLHLCCYIVLGIEPRFFWALYHWALVGQLKSLLTKVASSKSMNFHVCPPKGQVSGQPTLTSERENLPRGWGSTAERDLQQLLIISHLVPSSKTWETPRHVWSLIFLLPIFAFFVSSRMTHSKEKGSNIG